MERIEKYKSIIEKMLNTNIREKESAIKEFIKLDFENHKISEEECNELLAFLNEKIKQEEEKNEENNKENREDKENKESVAQREKNVNDFREKLKVNPIYKGETGKVAPKRYREER